MKEALWWHADTDGKILCTLCPRFCRLGEGQAGFCYIRKNVGGKLYSLGYGTATGFAVDPIEKKPLNHFLPGSEILSFGTAGCNLGCRFCQNWNISKAKLDEAESRAVTPEIVVQLAQRNRVPSIAFTYNDPVIWGEFVIDISRLARETGLKSVMVTAGYITPEARPDVFRYVDAANVDLKAFTERFYRKVTFSHLDPVLDTLKWLKNETDIWFEITNLLIPGENDDVDETKRLCDWVVENLGDSVPLHFTAFHPDFKLTDRPRTPAATLTCARRIAQAAGVRYSYVGNVHDDEGQTTYCPSCRRALIRRLWHDLLEYHLAGNRCPCGAAIAGRFSVDTAALARSVRRPRRV
ncbi:MAG: AmmeMemoRadiSam system radical SAM enzyme [Deltaproteobacteria bacterium]|nr:AmmeMemoRadiSam system radical SAM enzyme [Deltaproteobacteria bacterium]